MALKDNLRTLQGNINKNFNKFKFNCEVNKPEIYIGLGLFFGGAAVVSGIITTYKKLNTIIEEHVDKRDVIVEKIEAGDPDVKHEKTKLVATTVGKVAFAYVPTASLFGLSCGFVLEAYGVLNSRYLSAISAYNAVTTAFETYRGRVREKYGEDADREAYYGIQKKEIPVGEKGKEKETIDISVGDGVSQYSRRFEPGNVNYMNGPRELNITFLKGQQHMANIVYHSRGHMFLNEIYDMLGFPHTQAGQICGWMDGFGDKDISFGIDELNKIHHYDENGDEFILLDFNCDGVILDKLKS